MKVQSPAVPTKATCDEEVLLICGIAPTKFFLQVDWYALVNFRKPNLTLTFRSDSDEDWLIYDQLEILAEATGVSFEDAAHWAARRALGPRFEDARVMLATKGPWDPDIQYICRVLAVQLCKHLGPNDVLTIPKADGMIQSLLITDDELFVRSQSRNSHSRRLN